MEKQSDRADLKGGFDFFGFPTSLSNRPVPELLILGWPSFCAYETQPVATTHSTDFAIFV